MPGEFAENITTRGIEIHLCKPFDRFVSDNVELMVTQIGKKCHGDNCAIYQEVGNCVMPKKGIFVKVIRGGELKAGGELKYQPKILKIKIITLSDRASRGEYADKSGPFIKGYAAQFFDKAKRQFSFDYQVIPDETELLKQEISAAVSQNFDLIFTTGGTGIGPRDITPDVVKPLLDKEIPGIMELIRVKYGMQNPGAILSRSVAGIIANSLIYTMPGSPKAVKEYLDEILPTVEHAMRMIHGIDSH
jgi:molybdenum cofactor synthesis domain-containing protein